MRLIGNFRAAGDRFFGSGFPEASVKSIVARMERSGMRGVVARRLEPRISLRSIRATKCEDGEIARAGRLWIAAAYFAAFILS
jgi:hypothetical protein